MESDRQLSNAPVVFVIAAVRFESLEAMPSWVPAIQERVRRTLPRYRRMRQSAGQSGLEIAIDSEDFDEGDRRSSWLFSTIDHAVTATLFRTGLVLQTIKYSGFEDFAAIYREILQALIDSAGVVNVNQIGIRYVNHIRPQQTENGLKSFIVDALMPREASTELAVSTSSSFASYVSPEGAPHVTLKVRFTMGRGGSVIPEDLIPAFAVASIGPVNELGEQSLLFPQLDTGAGALDIDAVNGSLGGRQMSAEEMVAEVIRLHGTAKDYFQSVTTPEARKAWNAGSPA